MRFLSTRAHGIIDYVMGVLLIAAPWILGFHDNRAATAVPVVLGAGAILYSLLTRYELGLIRLIPMPLHLIIDLLSGVVLAASPWLFGFAHRIIWPHVVLGLLEIGVVLVTQRVPSGAATAGAARGQADVNPGLA